MPFQPPPRDRKSIEEHLKKELKDKGFDPDMPVAKQIIQRSADMCEDYALDLDRIAMDFDIIRQPSAYDPSLPTSPNWSRECNHKWKKYVGFTESYMYCQFCTEKKNIPEEEGGH